MKILKVKPWKLVFECLGCKSKLEAEESDVKHGQFGSMGDYDWEYYIECPVCKKCHFIENKDVPAKLKYK